MNGTKIRLSPEELDLVVNADWILTKNQIIRKAYDLFGMLAISMTSMLKSALLPEDVQSTSPKISKGENLQGFPYVILDYPRLFTREKVFAIRTLFWWGHYFVVTLHLKGEYKDLYQEALGMHLTMLASERFYIGISEDEWHHELGEDHFVALDLTNESERSRILAEQSVLRISQKIPLSEWNKAENLIGAAHRLLVDSLQS